MESINSLLFVILVRVWRGEDAVVYCIYQVTVGNIEGVASYLCGGGVGDCGIYSGCKGVSEGCCER